MKVMNRLELKNIGKVAYCDYCGKLTRYSLIGTPICKECYNKQIERGKQEGK